MQYIHKYNIYIYIMYIYISAWITGSTCPALSSRTQVMATQGAARPNSSNVTSGHELFPMKHVGLL